MFQNIENRHVEFLASQTDPSRWGSPITDPAVLKFETISEFGTMFPDLRQRARLRERSPGSETVKTRRWEGKFHHQGDNVEKNNITNQW
jgi:hypothetical protein